MRIINDSMVTLAQNIIQQNYNCQNPGNYDCGDNICNTHNMNLGTSPVPRITACPCGVNVAWSNYVQYSSGTVTGNNENCRFKIYYHLRYCNGAVEFYPYRVELLDNCQSFSINSIFERAIRVIIRDVGLRYGGNEDLRRRMPSCWRRIDNILIPCEMENCCGYTYLISLNQQNRIDIRDREPYQNQGNNNCNSPCILKCEDDIRPPETLERSFTYEESEFLSDSKTQLKIIPNPADDKIRIIFDGSSENGLMVINIFDGMGKLVHKSSYVKNFDPFYNEINITELSNGMYRYVVELDGMIYSTGSFIKLK